jgi:beta-lactamase regulating signal transducer with metallopeptidase domain
MLEWFAETTLVAAGLAIVAAMVGRLRGVGPTLRHVLWLVVLIKLVTPPLLSWPWAVPWQGLNWLAATPAAVDSPPVLEAAQDPPVCVAPPLLEDQLNIRPDASSPTSAVIAGLRAAMVDATYKVKTLDHAPVSCQHSRARWLGFVHLAALRSWVVFAWLTVSVIVGVGQSIRIVRFQQRLRAAVPAPETLVGELERIGQSLDVPVPELVVVPDLTTPLLWCLGRPQLVLPGRLVKTLALDQWRGILTHELAHLRRRDHWISRLEAIAGLVWWWNPIYWLTRARLDAEAELACDAWVIWAQPKDRLGYAEVLFDICTLSLTRPPAPTLGAAGSGRFFERRLTMILHEHVPCRLSPLGLLGVCLLVLFALPSWSTATPVPASPETERALMSLTQLPEPAGIVALDDDADDDDEKVVKKNKGTGTGTATDLDDDDDADDTDADDDDDDESTSRAKAKAKAEAKARAKLKKAEKAKKAARKLDASRVEQEVESKFGSGSEFEKRMEELGEQIGREIEEKFGPEFEKKMEKLGKEIEEKFGPEFEEKMGKLGKEIGEKFGSGSEFEKKMKGLGKEMEARFGPGSDFEKKMKDLGKEMESKFGPGSEFAKKLKESAAHSGSKASTVRSGKPASPAGENAAPAKVRRRERRIQELEAQVRKLVAEIKALKNEADRDENE